MKIRLYNARILTMQEQRAIFNGELHVCGNRITYVGEETAPGVFDREIDCQGNLLMPGFKNAHAHSAMSMLRSLADDQPLGDWLFKTIFPIEGRLTQDDIYHMTKLSVLEYLTSGITAAFDFYLSPEHSMRAFDEMGFRGYHMGGLYDYGQDYAWLERAFEKDRGVDALQTFVFGIHAEYTAREGVAENVAALVNKHHAPFYIHACETADEVEGCKERHGGMTPVQYLASEGLFNHGGAIFHGVHMSEEDFDAMARHGVAVVSCPGSNTKLASGIAPISEYLRRGIMVALGTDGPASNNCLDFFREMFLMAGLAKLRDNDAAAIDAREVLKMATVNGAEVMRLDDCDVLAEGKLADIIMIDLMQPNMQPINNIEKNLVYSGSKQNVKMTMVNGRILYMDGQFHCGITPQEVYAKVDEIKRRIMDAGQA